MAKRISILELRAMNIINQSNLPEPNKEFRFHPTRMWRFDFAWPELKIAVELEGGIWNGGAHTRGAHFNSDCNKYNAALILGWKVLRYTSNTLKDLPEEFKQLTKG